MCDLNIQFQYNHKSVQYMKYCTYCSVDIVGDIR